MQQPRRAMNTSFIIFRPLRKISSPLQNKVDFQLPEQHETVEYSQVFRNYNTLRNESHCKYKNKTYEFRIEVTIPCIDQRITIQKQIMWTRDNNPASGPNMWVSTEIIYIF